ncbi:hypothetical protein [Chromobacterium haemolyticum]|uniref:hypothetical protein n=1 Tax=Chromobacterium haemolyticum TaxID=394935 RepID=UPI001316074F|nr:hypothetical protein [Chromobacterium haemolyticum]BBH15054.1 hypothetical protein CH06BL_43020 [Chromobacterium haemolyticum]
MRTNADMVAQLNRWKTWVIQCVGAADRFGVAPLPNAQLHVLLYLANTLASYYSVDPIRGRVLKRGNFPFYPDIQREIDRLAFCGVLSIDKVDYGSRGNISARYSMGMFGEDYLEKLKNSSNEMLLVSRLFEELIGACVDRFLSVQVAIGPIDANYGANEVLEGEVVDFSEWKNENKNRIVADYILSRIAEIRPDARRDGVQLYCGYLDEALAIYE